MLPSFSNCQAFSPDFNKLKSRSFFIKFRNKELRYFAVGFILYIFSLKRLPLSNTLFRRATESKSFSIVILKINLTSSKLNLVIKLSSKIKKTLFSLIFNKPFFKVSDQLRSSPTNRSFTLSSSEEIKLFNK